MASVDYVLDKIKSNYPHQKLFYQAVSEVLTSIEPALSAYESFEHEALLERIVEPDKIIAFSVPWVDDSGNAQVNTGYRVQFNGVLGPYKGGIRFHPSVDVDTLKFLGFEQVFKNSLTGLPIGGGKGGANFDPKGKSDREIMSFCKSFISALYRDLGPDTDIPAGDIGVGAREIGYMFGQYRRLTNTYNGVLTSKGVGYGGSLGRTEATGFGLIYFVEALLADRANETFTDKTVVISGAGNVATHAAQKAQELGAHVVTLSDSSGWIYDENGIDLELVKKIKSKNGGRLSEYADVKSNVQYKEDGRVWEVPCDIALPCATQNELDLDDAKQLVENGCKVVGEGANMPSTTEAINYLQDSGILFTPGKASNAGGVATSVFEMSQNAMRIFWTFDEVNARLKETMCNIYTSCVNAAENCGHEGDLVVGANVAGFNRVAKAMIAQGF